MKELRILLLPIGAILELASLVFCWILALRFPATAEKATNFFMGKLPDMKWYLGKDND